MGRGKAYDTLMDEEDQIAPKAHAVFILMAMSGAVCSLPAHLYPSSKHASAQPMATAARRALGVGHSPPAFPRLPPSGCAAPNEVRRYGRPSGCSSGVGGSGWFQPSWHFIMVPP